MNESKQTTWNKVFHIIVQALIAALTALGVSSCVPVIF